MSKQQTADELTAMVAGVQPTTPDTVIDSPIRSGTGRIRNLKQMGDGKFAALIADMADSTDVEGLDALNAEIDRRGW